MPTYAIVLIVLAVALLVALAMGMARNAGQRAYPKQPKGVAHDHDFSEPAPPAQVEQRGIVLDFRHRQR